MIQDIKNLIQRIEELEKKKEITTGVEYETGKIIDGKKEYAKRINFGTLPNTSSKSVPHEIVNGAEIIDVKVFCNNANGIFGGIFFPHIASSTQSMEMQITRTDVFISCNKNASAYKAVVEIYYTKNEEG